MTSGVLGLADDDFWGDLVAPRAAALQRLVASPWRGYVLDAPTVVNLGVRDTLPVMLLRAVSAVESVRHDVQRNTVLVAVRRDTGETFVAKAFEQKYAPPARPPRVAPSASVTLCDGFAFELRARMPDLPWAPGSVTLYALVLDLATEPLVVHLAVPSGPSLHAGPTLDAPWPPRGELPLPRYTRGPSSPAVPVAPGVSLVCPRVQLLERDATCVLEGAFHIATAPTESVGEVVDEEPTVRTLRLDPARVPDDEPAYVRLTLVLTGEALDEVWRCPLVLPATRVGDARKGHFALDLFTLPDMPRAPGTYALWAFATDVIAGPSPLALVPEDRLAPP